MTEPRSRSSRERRPEAGAEAVPQRLKGSLELADKLDVSKCSPKASLSLAAILACLAFAAPVRAQQYSFRYYGIEEGLTNLAVKVLFQDRTGFLWAGTENGLFRFDGQRFQRYGPAEGLPHEVVLSLGEAPDGSLLAGYQGRSLSSRRANVSKKCRCRAPAALTATAGFFLMA